jgi:hypothetical protein
VVLCFDILSLITPLECSITAIVAAEHATLLASANTCRCTLLILCMSLAMLLSSQRH